MHKERLTLATIGGGAVQERVDRALEKVAKNIMDPNTDPGKKRVITLKITMKPDEDDREDVEVSADVQVSLAPEMGVSTHFFVSKDLKTDKVSVMEHRKGEIRGQLDIKLGMSHLCEQIGYDYDKAVEKCLKNKEKEDADDIGEEAMALAVKYAGKGKKKAKDNEQSSENTQEGQTTDVPQM